MDVIKIQIEVLKMLKKEPKNIKWYADDESVSLSFNPAFFFKFSSKNYHLNLDESMKTDAFDKLIKKLQSFLNIEAVLTGDLKQLDYTNAIILNAKDYKVYLDERYVKLFGRPKDLKFVVNPKSQFNPVLIYNHNDEFLGMITPLRFSI